jgi:DNA invertase Pin-like site-specific DNA recombinase
MGRDSANKQFEIVLVWKLDRFSPSRLDSATYRAILKHIREHFIPSALND